jgi:uncharacterized membrane protein YdjX (TVP38/TMEM64 family)
MHAILRFLTSLDRRAVRAVVVSLLLILAVALVFVLGRTTAIFDEDDAPLINWMQANAESPWALPVTILVFCAAAFLGAPQFVLLAGAVVAFGPTRGFWFAWIATMTSASVTYLLGRYAGQDVLRRFGGSSINRLSEFIGRNGIQASFIARFLPLGPFIVVNMAAGASHMRYWMFFVGTGLGQLPKIAFVAFAGQSVIAWFTDGNLLLAIPLALAALAWLGVMLYLRRIFRSETDQKNE